MFKKLFEKLFGKRKKKNKDPYYVPEDVDAPCQIRPPKPTKLGPECGPGGCKVP